MSGLPGTGLRQAIRNAALAAILCTTVLYFNFYRSTFRLISHKMPRDHTDVLPTWIYAMHRWSSLRGKYSQGAQDFYLERIFSVLGETNRYFVEFGFNEDSYESGGSGANTRKLHRKGWRGLLLDAGHENPAINLKRHFLYATNIGQIFRESAVPTELDYLSCDMDSHDLWVFRAILQAGYRPRVISTEFNANYPLTDAIALMDPSLIANSSTSGNATFEFAGCAWGASARALYLLATEYGYVMVARVSGLDLFWVRGDLLESWMLIPDFKWFFHDFTLGPRRHRAQTNSKGLRQIVDYETFVRTDDFNASNRVARNILKVRDLECFRRVYRKL